MTYDPREEKLPRWARDLLEQERLKSALAWPTVPEPTPAAVFDSNGAPNIGSREDADYWRLSPGYHITPAQVFLRGGYIHRSAETTRLGGSRPEGIYYRTRDDALAAAWWEECRRAARKLLTIKEQLE